MTGNSRLSAYDFRHTEIYAPEGYSQAHAETKIRSGQRKRSGRVNPRPLAVCGAILAAALLCGSLLAQVRLNEVSQSTVSAEKRTEQLRKEQARLKIEHEEAFSLERIEKYATEILGMCRPGADQTAYTRSREEAFSDGR